MDKGKAPASANSLKNFGPQHKSGSSSKSKADTIQFGSQHLAILPIDSTKGFKPLKGCSVSIEQQVLMDALYCASTPTAKLNAINALNYYFSKMLPDTFQKTEKKYYVLFRGDKPGVYQHYGKLQAAIGTFEKPAFKGFPTLEEALHSASGFFDESNNMNYISSYLESLQVIHENENEKINEEVLRSRLAHFKRMNRILNSSVQNHLHERKRLNRKIAELTKEVEQLSYMEENSTESYKKMVQLMGLNYQYRHNFLNALPEEIRKDIIRRTKDSLQQDLLGIQEFLWDCRQKGTFYPQISYIQYDDGETGKGSNYPLLVKINNGYKLMDGLVAELFFAGFVHYMKFPTAPEFLGKKVSSMINQYFNSIHQSSTLRPWIIFQVFSTHPEMKNGDYKPALHHIIVFNHGEMDLLDFLPPTERTICDFTSTKVYDEFPHEEKRLYLLCETSIIKVWTTRGDICHPTLKRFFFPHHLEPENAPNSDEDVMAQLDALMEE